MSTFIAIPFSDTLKKSILDIPGTGTSLEISLSTKITFFIKVSFGITLKCPADAIISTSVKTIRVHIFLIFLR